MRAEVRYRSTSDVAAKSAYLVVAQCTGVEVAAVEKYGGNIFTFSHFRVETTISGTLESEFTLRLFGGQLGDVIVDAPSVPRFRAGERVVLLLGEKNADGYPVVSIQGVFRVRDDPGGRAGIIETPITEFPLRNAGDGSAYPKMPQRVKVEDFVYSLRNQVSGTAPPAQATPVKTR